MNTNEYFRETLEGVLTVRELEKILFVSVICYLFFFSHAAVEISLLVKNPEVSHWTLFVTVLILNVGLVSVALPVLVLRKIRLIA